MKLSRARPLYKIMRPGVVGIIEVCEGVVCETEEVVCEANVSE